jgi:hypothetical protein
MKILGFNLTKIHAEKLEKLENISINNQVSFINFEKEKVNVLKDSELFKLFFKYELHFQTPEKDKERSPEIHFEGSVLLSLDKEESKEFQKSWKKKQIPQTATIPLYNVILKRCTIRALQLEEDIGLPVHVSIPQISPKKQ